MFKSMVRIPLNLILGVPIIVKSFVYIAFDVNRRKKFTKDPHQALVNDPYTKHTINIILTLVS